MVYKRKARVLFVGTGDASRAIMATAFANSLGQHFMQARALVLPGVAGLPELVRVMQEVGLEVSDQPLYALSSNNLVWADLLVALDQAAATATATASAVLPRHVQKRCYPFDLPHDLVSLRSVRDAVRRRVEGMVGGMAMLVSDNDSVNN